MSQHLDELDIPVIEIRDGWAAEEVSSEQECLNAYAYLMSAVAEIEYQIDCYDLGQPFFTDPLWIARARRALKYKRAALQIVNTRKGQMARAHREKREREGNAMLLNHIRDKVSDEQFLQWVRESGCTEFMEAA
jgi:hypothetical protein